MERIKAALPAASPVPAALPADPVERARALALELLAALRELPEFDARERRLTQLRLLLVDLEVLAMAAEPVPTPTPAPAVLVAG